MKRPIAYQSPLWPHLEQIRSWRRARLTWREIKERLEGKPYHVNLTIQAIHSFFVTASKRKDPPIGFDSLPGQPVPQEPTKQAQIHAKKEEPAAPQKPGDKYRKAVLEDQSKPTNLFDEKHLN